MESSASSGSGFDADDKSESPALGLVASAGMLILHMWLSAATSAGRAVSVQISDVATGAPSEALHEVISSSRSSADMEELARELDRKFVRWQSLRFEDGIENELSRTLYRLLMERPKALIEALAGILVAEKVSPRVAGEALRHLGRFTHAPSHQERLWLLARSLRLASPLTKDGAALGIAHLNDPAAIPYLQAAIAAEPGGTLRDDLEDVLASLQHADDASTDQA